LIISPFTLVWEDLTSAKFLGVVTGAALLASIGAANAGQRLTLTDAQMDAVTAGANDLNFFKDLTSLSSNNVNFNANSQVLDLFQKLALINVQSHVTGNSASLGFDNEAVGKNSTVQGTFSQIAIAGQGSSQTGLFVAAANR
jgi:hypothetical protein